MAKSKHAQIITGEQIVVVSPNGRGGYTTHMVPKKNLSSLKGYNSKLQPEKRSLFFEYQPEQPDMAYYIGLANSAKGRGSEKSPENNMALKKVLEANSKLEQTNDKLAKELKEQAKTMADLKAQLEAIQKEKKPAKEKNPAA